MPTAEISVARVSLFRRSVPERMPTDIISEPVIICSFYEIFVNILLL
jgi:hypothetical protein